MRAVFAVDAASSGDALEPIRDATWTMLQGMQLRRSAVGSVFEVGDWAVQLVEIDGTGLLTHPSQIEIRVQDTSAINLDRIAGEIRAKVGDHLRDVQVVAPDAAASGARTAFDRLVGVPKDEVLGEVVSYLESGGWADAWSREHYGRQVAVAHLPAQRPPLVLLEGESGTGKTALARAIPALAAEWLQEPIVFLQLSEHIRGRGIQGRAGAALADTFEAVADACMENDVPAVLFLDEAESVVSDRDGMDLGSGAQENLALVDALIVALERLRASSNSRIALIMATNLVTRLDPAIRRRASVFAFRRLDERQRRTLLELWLEDLGLDGDAVDAVNDVLGRHPVAPSAADVLHGVLGAVVTEAARGGHPITETALLRHAMMLVPTPTPAPSA